MSKFSKIIILMILFFTLLPHVNAQAKQDYILPENLTIVIGILFIMFSIVSIIFVYAKFCHGNSRLRDESQPHLGPGLLGSTSRFSGIDQKVIDSLPFFRFSSIRGSKEGLECAVCLSQFEDIEVLRLLPKCKHAFHVSCIDNWLEKHSSCPLCRCRISEDDVANLHYSNSMRDLRNSQPELPEDPNIELFVQREEDHHDSSRFIIGSSFIKNGKGSKEEEVLNHTEAGECDGEEKRNVFHKHKHKIVASDFVFMNRWSNLSSSDLMFLNKEMLGDMSSNRFSSLDSDIIQRSDTREPESEKIKEEMEIKRSFESRISIADKNNLFSMTGNPLVSDSNASTSRITNLNERSISDSTTFSRFGDFNENAISNTSVLDEADVKDDRIRQIWLPIAKKTVQWFANREQRSQQSKTDDKKNSLKF